MTELRTRLEAMQQRIDERTLRERIILFLTLALVLYLLVNSLLLDPLEAQQKQLLDRTRAVHSEIAVLDQQIVTMIETSRHDPDAEQRLQLHNLERRSTQLQQQIQEALSGQIAPHRMSVALQEILAGQQGLRLLRVENLPPEPLQEPLDASSSMIYRHGLVMELEGDFRSTLAYLRMLEGLEWQLRWDGLSIETGEYPRATIRMRLHTLSMQRGWLGV